MPISEKMFFFCIPLKSRHVWPNALCFIVRENSNREKKNVYVVDYMHVLHMDAIVGVWDMHTGN